MSEKRKGVIITNLLPNPVERTRGMFVWQETLRLLKRYDLRAISPLPWVPAFMRNRPRFAHHVVPSQADINGFTIEYPRHVVIPRILRSSYGLLLKLGITGVFERLRREHKPDFIVAHYAFPDGWAAWRLARRYGIPLIIKVRGSDVNVFTDEASRRKHTLAALRGADHVVAVSRALRNKMIALGLAPDRITVVSNGIDSTRFHPRDRAACRSELNLEPDPFIFLFIGSMRKIKGVFNLIEAFTALPDDLRRQARLVMIGDGELRQEVADRIGALGADSGITLLPPVDHDGIPAWLGAADCLVLPSVMEGYPNVLVEALACERPVIASRVGGIPEIVRDGETGILIPPEEQPLLTGAMRTMLAGFPFDAAAAEAASRDWEAVADDMSAIIERIVANRQGGVQ
ncbi:MAG: glycosyltransferase family 4 protein [bacterium]|nr:glycosyltransferase family 4 protein [bacterium]